MIYLTVDQVVEVHDMILAATDIGLAGIKDDGLLASGVDRAENKAYYEPDSDEATLAAAVCFGIAQAHGFNDANKRTAVLCCELFLDLNGLELTLSNDDLLEMMVKVANKELSEQQLADTIRLALQPKVELNLEEEEDLEPEAEEVVEETPPPPRPGF